MIFNLLISLVFLIYSLSGLGFSKENRNNQVHNHFHPHRKNCHRHHHGKYSYYSHKHMHHNHHHNHHHHHHKHKLQHHSHENRHHHSHENHHHHSHKNHHHHSHKNHHHHSHENHHHHSHENHHHHHSHENHYKTVYKIKPLFKGCFNGQSFLKKMLIKQNKRTCKFGCAKLCHSHGHSFFVTLHHHQCFCVKYMKHIEKSENFKDKCDHGSYMLYSSIKTKVNIMKHHLQTKSKVFLQHDKKHHKDKFEFTNEYNNHNKENSGATKYKHYHHHKCQFMSRLKRILKCPFSIAFIIVFLILCLLCCVKLCRRKRKKIIIKKVKVTKGERICDESVSEGGETNNITMTTIASSNTLTV